MKTGGAEKGESSHVAPAARGPETCGGLRGAPRPRRPAVRVRGGASCGRARPAWFPRGLVGQQLRLGRCLRKADGPGDECQPQSRCGPGDPSEPAPRVEGPPGSPASASATSTTADGAVRSGGRGGGVRPAGQEAWEQPGKAPQFPAGGLPEGAVLTCVSAVWAGLAPAGGPGQNSSLAFSSFWKPLRPVAGPHRCRGKSGIFSSPRLCPPGLRLLRTL